MRIRTRGILIWEAFAAMVLLAAVATLLITSMNTRQRIDQRLDTRMMTTEAARAALLYRQAGKAYSAPEGVRIESRILEAGPGEARQWIAVRATAGQDSIELIGLAPTVSPSPAGGKAGAP